VDIDIVTYILSNINKVGKRNPLLKAYPSMQYTRVDTKGKFYQSVPSNSSECVTI